MKVPESFLTSGINGKWLDKKNLKTGDILKLTTEPREVPSQQGGTQLVAKALVKGGDTEAKNVAINKPTVRALIEAFGDDMAAWVNKPFGVHIERTVVAGKRGIAMYLLPDDYEVSEDDGGFLVVRRKGEDVNIASDEIHPEDIPF